jgi:hypothetical protein
LNFQSSLQLNKIIKKSVISNFSLYNILKFCLLGEERMKTSYSFKSFCHPTAFILLVLSILLVQHKNSQEKFWVPAYPPRAHYKIDARINLLDNTVEGKETIILDNNSSRRISLLGVDWSINNSRSIEISINGKSLPLLNAVKKPPISSPLLYSLPKPVTPGSRIKLNVKFSRGGLTGGDKKEIKLIKWYPRVWWDGLPTHDVFEVKLDIPAGYALAASGRLNKATGYYENGK